MSNTPRKRYMPDMSKKTTNPQAAVQTQQPSDSQQTGANRSKQIGKYRVEVIRDKCIAAGSCVFIAPKVFELDEENLVRILSQEGNDDESKLLAAQSCPTAAIRVIDTETNTQIWPIE